MKLCIFSSSLISESLTTNALASAAKGSDLIDFINKYNGELTPAMIDAGKKPKEIIHDTLDPNDLDPSEWDEWDEPPVDSSNAKVDEIAAAIKRGEKIPPVLVQGSPLGKFMPQVLEGHHRTAAAIKAGAKIPVMFTMNTLIGMWKRANGVEQTAKELRKHYEASL
jgi:hypothetical protein